MVPGPILLHENSPGEGKTKEIIKIYNLWPNKSTPESNKEAKTKNIFLYLFPIIYSKVEKNSREKKTAQKGFRKTSLQQTWAQAQTLRLTCLSLPIGVSPVLVE